MLDYTFNRAKLKSQPISVLESNYINLSDSIFSDSLTGKFNDSWTYNFDKEGNIISVKIFFDSSFGFQQFYKFNEDGESYEFISSSKGDTTKRIMKSRKIAEGKYKRDIYDSDQKRYSEIWTFTDGGQQVIKERYISDTLAFTVKEFYEKGLLKKISQTEKSGISENVFYYSKNNYLDSQVLFLNKNPFTKYIFINNDYGDFVYYERSSSGEVEQRKWMKYQYDNKGNWIKMIERSEDKRTDYGIGDTSQKLPGCRLIVREIKY